MFLANVYVTDNGEIMHLDPLTAWLHSLPFIYATPEEIYLMYPILAGMLALIVCSFIWRRK